MEIELAVRQTSSFLYLHYIIYLYVGTLFDIYVIGNRLLTTVYTVVQYQCLVVC